MSVRLAVRAIALTSALFVIAIGYAHSTEAHHDVHYNSYYWQEWAYWPLTSVNAYDCIDQNNALQGAASEWNASGYVLITTQIAICDLNQNGIRWRQGTAQCYGSVALAAWDAKTNYLDPDSLTPPTNRALRVDVTIGTTCPDGDSTCAGWYSPCDVLTHELGHALGLADHYLNACLGCGPSHTVFSYPNPPVNGTPAANIPTTMDYPHVTSIQPHDSGDLNTLYRRAPFSPGGLDVSYENFHRINMGAVDRAHNETAFYIERSVGGGSYDVQQILGRDPSPFIYGQDVTAPGQSYCYRIKGLNDWSGSGAYSSSDCTTPPHAVGSGITGSFPSGSTSVGLCWNPAPSGSGVTGYYVLRRRNNGNGTYTNKLYLEPTDTDCYGNGKVAWIGSVSSTSYKYHWSVKGCDGAWGCSEYRDMTSPSYAWVRLPWTGSGNSGSPNSGYHSH